MGKIIEHPKPLSKKEWEFWEDRLGFFIQEFDDNIGAMARSNIEADEGDSHDHFLAGMSQGMWAIYNFVEDRMVQTEDRFKGTKRKYKKSGKYKKRIIKTPTGGYLGERRPVGRPRKNSVVTISPLEKENRGRVGLIPSKEIMRELNKFYNKNDKRTRLTIEQIKVLLERSGLIPKKINRRKVMKILCDRFFILTRKGLVLQFKKNGKNCYKLP